MGRTQDARSWLRENGYEDVADLVEKAIAQWARHGVKTRRNWWVILSGDKNGNPRKLAGTAFPVLRAAQIRQGRPVTPNSLCRNPREKPPGRWKTGRWPSKN